MNFKEYFLEAISLKTAKKKRLTRKESGAYQIDVLNKIFGDKDRLVYPIDASVQESTHNPLLDKVFDIIHKHFNMTIRKREDYIKGVAYKIMDNKESQPYKIGRLLAKLEKEGNEEAGKLLIAFRDDPMRSTKKANKTFVIISRHPYDVAGMSTDRNWTSCMNLGTKSIVYKDKNPKQNVGINAHYVPRDISAGSIVAYLVSDEDRHPNGKFAIRKPFSRILMKPYENKKNSKDVVYSIGRTYGISNTEFSRFVENWLRTEVNTDTKDKEYIKRKGLYDDSDRPVNFNVSSESHKRNNIRTAFFNELGYSHTDEKYFQHFNIVDHGEIYGTRAELHVIFPIPESVPLFPFHYTRNESRPEIVNKILATAKNIQGFYQIQSQIDVNNRVIIFEFLSYMQDDEEEKYVRDDDQEIEMWEHIFKYDMNIRKFDYKKIRDEILALLKNYDHDSAVSEAKEKFKKKLNESMEDLLKRAGNVAIFKESVDFIKKHYAEAKVATNELIKIINSGNGNELIDLYEYFMSNPEKEEMLRHYKNHYRIVYNFLTTAIESFPINDPYISYTDNRKLCEEAKQKILPSDDIFVEIRDNFRKKMNTFYNQSMTLVGKYQSKLGWTNIYDWFHSFEDINYRGYNSLVEPLIPE